MSGGWNIRHYGCTAGICCILTLLAAPLYAQDASPPPSVQTEAKEKQGPVLDRVGDALLNIKRDIKKKEKTFRAGMEKILENVQPPVQGGALEGAVPEEAPVIEETQEKQVPVSIMFSAEDMDNLSKVIEAYEKRKQFEAEHGGASPEDGTGEGGAGSAEGGGGAGDGFVDSLIRGIEGEQAAAPSQEAESGAAQARNFYLDSIMYLSTGNWAIWINGKKISHDTQGEADIKIEEISREKVTFAWEAGNLDALSPHWQEKIKLVGDKDAAGNAIVADPKTQTVHVTLRPNQTFISRAMEVVEGDVSGASKKAAPAKKGAPSGNPRVDIPIGAPEAPDTEIPESDDSSAVDAVRNIAGKKYRGDERAMADDLSNLYKGIGKGMGIVPADK